MARYSDSSQVQHLVCNHKSWRVLIVSVSYSCKSLILFEHGALDRQNLGSSLVMIGYLFIVCFL